MENTFENTTQQMIDFLGRRYSFRYNTLLGYNEYRETNAAETDYKPLCPRTRNRMTLELQLEGIDASLRDVRNYLESDYIRPYDPIGEYLHDCDGIWDGHDHIADLAATVPTDAPLWKEWFTTWLLAMVDQWQGNGCRVYGNSVAPLLISPQGYNKSTFCRQLLPQQLAWGYTDSLNISEKRNVMTAMSQQLLINLDEFNQISPTVQQGFLKNIIQLPHVRIRRPYASHFEDVRRTASFIATSNLTDILSDPSGNRRFIGIELTAPIDVSHAPDHRQLFAQALHMLRHGSRPWFDKVQTQTVMQWNRRYEIKDPVEQFFRMFFTPATLTDNNSTTTEGGTAIADGGMAKAEGSTAKAEGGTAIADGSTAKAEGGLAKTEGDLAKTESTIAVARWLTAAEIFGVIKQKVGSSLKVTSLNNFGRKLANMPDLPKRRFAVGMKYRVIRIG